MTPYEGYEHDQDRIEAQDAAAQERRSLGAADAAFGYAPQYADAAYLVGYVAKLKELPRDAEGKIQHYSPYKQFAYGWIDGAERFSEEF